MCQSPTSHWTQLVCLYVCFSAVKIISFYYLSFIKFTVSVFFYQERKKIEVWGNVGHNCNGFGKYIPSYHQLNHSGIIGYSMVLLSIFGSFRTTKMTWKRERQRRESFNFYWLILLPLCVSWYVSKSPIINTSIDMLTEYACIVKYDISSVTFSFRWFVFFLSNNANVNKMFSNDDWQHPPNNRQI